MTQIVNNLTIRLIVVPGAELDLTMKDANAALSEDDAAFVGCAWASEAQIAPFAIIEQEHQT
jgi:hypothetical protein